LIVATYLLSFPYHPRLRSPNELSRLMQTRAIVDFGDLDLNRAMRVYGPIGDLSVVRGRYYPSKAPLMSFAAVPVYAVLRTLSGGKPGSVPEIPLVFWSRLFLTVAPTLAMLVVLRRFLAAHVAPVIADALTMTYALGTLAFSYSLLFMSHQTTAVLLFAAFYGIWHASRSSERRAGLLLAAGVLAALAVAAEYTSALCAGLLAVYVGLIASPRTARSVLTSVAMFGAGALPVLGLLMLYQAHVFGGPFDTGYQHLADVAYQPWHQGGFLGIKTPEPYALVMSLFSPLRGLLALSPVLILGFGGLGLLWRRKNSATPTRSLAVLTVLLVLGYLYFTASFSYASWGWTTGPRHLTGLVPFLLLPAALVFERLSDGQVRGVPAGLALGSVVVTSALTSINYIPDDISEGVFGLFLPLAERGDVLPSMLNVLGLVNPWGGWVCLLLVALVAMGLTGAIVRGRRWGAQLVLAAATAAVVLVSHWAAFKETPAERGALELLNRDWLATPGVRWRFWSWDGRE
jgi:hypothetical protein